MYYLGYHTCPERQTSPSVSSSHNICIVPRIWNAGENYKYGHVELSCGVQFIYLGRHGLWQARLYLTDTQHVTNIHWYHYSARSETVLVPACALTALHWNVSHLSHCWLLHILKFKVTSEKSNFLPEFPKLGKIVNNPWGLKCLGNILYSPLRFWLRVRVRYKTSSLSVLPVYL